MYDTVIGLSIAGLCAVALPIHYLYEKKRGTYGKGKR